MNRFFLALDLKDDPGLIGEYERWHTQVPAPIVESIRGAGITDMEIYRTGNRLFMMMETVDEFSFPAKQAMDEGNPAVQEWEKRMNAFQQALPWAKPGEKWVVMERIFKL